MKELTSDRLENRSGGVVVLKYLLREAVGKKEEVCFTEGPEARFITQKHRYQGLVLGWVLTDNSDIHSGSSP